ncbi:neutral/alkaline non-lysosomal ceramidase N-terminal domain-containing protein, partial [Salmonella sp. s51228]|uniref:neutral/alkaline non-lysosomal ceramidase N-terminal domain-containing protein n=1 Tax=Salmonella sp. s51228 TaxID=3159652 RepID=UPI00397F3C18
MQLHYTTLLLIITATQYLCHAKYGLPLSKIISKLSAEDTYLVGMGRYDITGPIAEVNMMGYAMLNQIAHGIHLRQYSRAFVISSGTTQLTFISIDACMGTQIVKQLVLEKLMKLYPKKYSDANLMISAIHTHSGPAGF